MHIASISSLLLLRPIRPISKQKLCRNFSLQNRGKSKNNLTKSAIKIMNTSIITKLLQILLLRFIHYFKTPFRQQSSNECKTARTRRTRSLSS